MYSGSLFISGGLASGLRKALRPWGRLRCQWSGLCRWRQCLRGHTDSAGMVASLAHLIPMLALLKDMMPRGKVINVAFAVSAAFVLGSHLGFVAGMKKEMAAAMIIGKLAGGITAVAAAA